MTSDPFDYGDEDTSQQLDDLPAEFGDLFGTDDIKPTARPPRVSFLDEIGLRVAVQVAVAVVLLLVAGGLIARDAWVRHSRETAFHQILDANERRDYLRVIDGAEKFLNRRPINGSTDPRQADVVGLYREALVHWVAQQPGELNSETLAHITRYKQLVKSDGK